MQGRFGGFQNFLPILKEYRRHIAAKLKSSASMIEYMLRWRLAAPVYKKYSRGAVELELARGNWADVMGPKSSLL